DRGTGYRITAAANTAAARRTGTAYVGYQPLIVDQAGTGGPRCTFQLISADTQFPTTRGTAGVALGARGQERRWPGPAAIRGRAPPPRPGRRGGPRGGGPPGEPRPAPPQPAAAAVGRSSGVRQCRHAGGRLCVLAAIAISGFKDLRICGFKDLRRPAVLDCSRL